ncbi:MAG: efflux RND transporter periplasmic adaptor subunit [Nevskiaceae bacterium]|jgi:cobalt-zinc-cadmium efflux system membrane fusion protein|nr:efflux RND transporter periplasmic adaptor subunit [Nevskiaceae bacterium]
MTKRNLIVTGVVMAALILVGGWLLAKNSNQTPAVAEQSSADSQEAAGVLIVDAERAAVLGITQQPAIAAAEAPIAVIPGIIQPPANARVAVAATFPGVVLRTLAVEGDTVTRGQALAIVSSREVLTMGADLARANARLGVAKANAQRLAQLSREGIIAGARADEANAAAAEAQADVSEKTRILAMVNAHAEDGTYTLTAPIAGRVTTASIQAGNMLDGSTAPYVIDAADRYEVTGQLPERLVGVVQPGMSVSIAPDVTGRVIAAGTTIDATTRSASVKAEITGGPGIIAGRTINFSIAGPAPSDAVSVPTRAVTMLGGKDIVFVTAPQGYAIREVTLGGATGDQIVLLSGVRAGEQIVTEGISALKALALSQ